MSISRFALKKPEDLVLSEESATAQVMQLLEHYGLDVTTMPQDVADAMEATLEKLAHCARAGMWSIDSKGGEFRIVQHLKTPPGDVSEISYAELRGKHKVAMAGRKDDNYGKTYELLGALSGEGSDAIAALKGRDLSLAESLGLVFLSV